MEKIEKINLVVKHNALINATSDYKFERNELKLICFLISNKFSHKRLKIPSIFNCTLHFIKVVFIFKFKLGGLYNLIK